MGKWKTKWTDRWIRFQRWMALREVKKNNLACPVCDEHAFGWNPAWGHNYICCCENHGWIMKKKIMTLRTKKNMDRKYKQAQEMLRQITASYNELPAEPKKGLVKQGYRI